MTDDLVKYCNCMEEVKRRMGLVMAVIDRSITTTHEMFDIELVFVQFRKTLELIAFASLTANRAKYSAAFESFASHWNAKWMLRDLETVNADYYPVPIEQPQTLPTGVKHCERVLAGFLTKEDFATLYNTSSKILHARNPFTKDDPVINIGHSVTAWVDRIQRLLGLHIAHLVSGDVVIVNVPRDGKVQAWLGSTQP